MNPFIPFENLRWESDWNGYEVGFDEVSVVGLYSWDEGNFDFLINMESMEILQIFSLEEEE